MELLKAIEDEVLKQKAEEVLNKFSTVEEFGKFILETTLSSDVSVELTMCCLRAERLKGNQGTRVTLINEAQHEVFEPTANAHNDLTPLKQKRYLAQVTVWDAKGNTGAYKKANFEFQSGAVYKLFHVDGVGFYADIAKGNVQHDRGNYYKVYELKPPLKKRKHSQDESAPSSKSAGHASKGSAGSNSANDDVAMSSESKNDDNYSPVTTRSKRGHERHP